MPEWMASWGEADLGAEYAAAAAAGPRAIDPLLTRRVRREERYWKPIREAEARERQDAQLAAIKQARAAHAADVRAYRARKKAERLALWIREALELPRTPPAARSEIGVTSRRRAG